MTKIVDIHEDDDCVIQDDVYAYWYKCPSCKLYSDIQEHDNYCGGCGAKLNWIRRDKQNVKGGKAFLDKAEVVIEPSNEIPNCYHCKSTDLDESGLWCNNCGCWAHEEPLKDLTKKDDK